MYSPKTGFGVILTLAQIWSTALPKDIIEAGEASGAIVFNPDNSSTFNSLDGYTWSIRYGDNSAASGIVGTDNVKIGSITVEAQPIELANEMSTQLQNQTSSCGLLGLAFGSINTVKPTPVKTPLENMILQKDIPIEKSLFTCYLGSYKDASDPDHGESFYTFGEIWEPAIPRGRQISYTPVNNSDGFWKFSAPSAVINGNTLGLGNNTAIADTGTTLMMVSDQVCEELYGAIEGAYYSKSEMGWVFPRNVPTKTLPDFAVAVGTQTITIEKEHFGFAGINGTELVYGGIQSRGSLPFDIWGDVFLKGVYAVRDHRFTPAHY